ncbi:CRAL-TRIO domain-containing protein [Meloidogyne graminicola]|uniref:CRAL-TRIO domain-containing protein n=1 Tax=Meloidogyne graminicola TaxID=189291 RepID=A0A8T0A2J9_9BILA|nr:CRAL-TRIO domain-containing protein [Meloidogyne graminicola]
MLNLLENLTEADQKLILQIRSHPKFIQLKESTKTITDFDLLRWANAYNGDIEKIVSKFCRHIRIRKIIGLDFIEHFNENNGLDEFAEEYAPMEILGPLYSFQLNETDGRIRYSSFMLNRFRIMERIMNEIHNSERKTGKKQSAILVLDLAGMAIHTGLISFITGPYRIMWGTLLEQYPSFLSAIICLNCTSIMKQLWNACTPFLGDEYKQKVYLLGQEDEWLNTIDPKPLQIPIFELSPELNKLEELSIPAGEFLLKTYFFEKDEHLQFIICHERELTINILFSEKRKTIIREQISKAIEGEEEDLCEIYAGCERPGLLGIDYWNWSWILPVTLKFQIFRKQQNKKDEKQFQQKLCLQPIPEEYIFNNYD